MKTFWMITTFFLAFNSPSIGMEINADITDTDNAHHKRHHGGGQQQGTQLLKEFEPIGAAGNNEQHPELNPVPGMPQLAIIPPSGLMGTGPNPRMISNVVSGGQSASGENSNTPSPNASAWLYVFGQFVDHDLGFDEAPPTNDSIPITVAPGDPSLPNGGTIAMNRATTDPTTLTAINFNAGFLDLSTVYGSDQPTADSLRGSNGTLLTSSDTANSADAEQYLPIVNGAFTAGDIHVPENFELTALHTLMMREHNRLAAMLAQENPNWTSDQLYNMARAILQGEYQHIVYTEFLPVLLGPNAIPPYKGYNPNVNTQETEEFSVAAFRVGHTLVSNCQSGLDNNGNMTFNETEAQTINNTPAQDITFGIDNLLRGITGDVSQADDVYAVPSLRNLLAVPLGMNEVDMMDLIAIDIQRARDAGIGTLNQTRVALGMPAYTSFTQLTSDPTVQTNLQQVYGSIDAVELFEGGLAETPVASGNVGATFQAIIADQFTRVRDGDRFYWQNENFDEKTKQMISGATLSKMILANSNTTSQPANAFLQAPAAAVSPAFRQKHPLFVPGPMNNN